MASEIVARTVEAADGERREHTRKDGAREAYAKGERVSARES